MFDCSALSRLMYGDGDGPTKENYADYFHTLLYLEEYAATQTLEQYNMSDVPVKIVTDNRLELGVSVRTFFLAV
jgi:hypothetical protein